jgi:uncharacterized membrane protein
MADIHRQHLIQRQMGIEHHHRGHHFGDRRHRAHQIRLAGIDDFFVARSTIIALPEAISGCEAVTAAGFLLTPGAQKAQPAARSG